MGSAARESAPDSVSELAIAPAYAVASISQACCRCRYPIRSRNSPGRCPGVIEECCGPLGCGVATVGRTGRPGSAADAASSEDELAPRRCRRAGPATLCDQVCACTVFETLVLRPPCRKAAAVVGGAGARYSDLQIAHARGVDGVRIEGAAENAWARRAIERARHEDFRLDRGRGASPNPSRCSRHTTWVGDSRRRRTTRQRASRPAA